MLSLLLTVAQVNKTFISINLSGLSGTTKNARMNRGNTSIVNETVVMEDVRFVITMEGLLSLALVQLPGISLGTLGIMKGVINHGMTSQGAKDSLRSSLLNLSSLWYCNILKFCHSDPASCLFSHFSSWNFLGFLNSFCRRA